MSGETDLGQYSLRLDMTQTLLSDPRRRDGPTSGLGHYLVKPALNDVVTGRAFYMWITSNVSYDAAGFQSNSIDPQDATTVLRRRAGACKGFATLFKELCGHVLRIRGDAVRTWEVDIPCKTISGFAKCFGHHPGHWNIVFVIGDWCPIEVTWGARPIDKNYQFVRQLEELHFVIDPNLFVIKHYPFMNNSLSNSALYQLLRRPISLEKFSKAAVHNRGIEWGFESTRHRHQVAEMDVSFEITARCTRTKLERMMCYLKDENTGTDFFNYVLIRKRDNGDFTISPPRPGTYTSKIFGQTASNGVSYHL